MTLTRWVNALALLLICTCGSEFGRGAYAASTSLSPQQQLVAPAGVKAALHAIVEVGALSELRWPDFPDYRTEVKEFYEPESYMPAWLRGTRATPQALAFIALFQNAASQGLRPEDYDGPRWSGRLARLRQTRPLPTDSDWARFDVALTVSAMRYVSDLTRGRVYPPQLQFGPEVIHESTGLAEILRQRLTAAPNIAAALERLEPPFPAYRRTVNALESYSTLAREDDGEPLPTPGKTVKPGDLYAGVPRLVRLLRLVGDLASGAVVPADGTTYDATLAGAVKRFQIRHGLEPDGWIGQQTIKALNTPLSHRLLQLQLALERWRWLPHEFAQPPIIVNIPEFSLHAYNSELDSALSLKVVVGTAYRHQTPVFSSEMKYVIFRPPWNVPLSIQIKELAPKIAKDPNYLRKEDYEITDRFGNVVSDGETNEVIMRELRAGKLALRQRPGPNNSLGLIKFVFPNDHDVYLHDTPALSLFSRSRRDFSHGCIRVEDAAALAAWVLRDMPEWTVDKIRAAMNGDKTVPVSLNQPIPVIILYTTAVVMENGEVRFFEDIYKQDLELEQSLTQDHP